jgi:hypothetical protein
MHNVNQFSLFKITYKLYYSWHFQCCQFPKKDRFTIGQKTENLLLDILTLVVSAYHSKDLCQKEKFLSRANISHECLKIIIRLAKDVRALDKNRYIEYESQLQEIGKMIGGWLTSLRKTNR